MANQCQGIQDLGYVVIREPYGERRLGLGSFPQSDESVVTHILKLKGKR